MAFSDIPSNDLKKFLASDSPDLRVAALRTICRHDLDPYDYLGVELATLPTYVPERIWWTISLENSTAPETNELLMKLLDDPHPLVACKAYNSIGRRKYRAAVPAIIEALETSRHWYVQGYAYNALRTLGWKQTASN
jgi:HEAT repeat protein